MLRNKKFIAKRSLKATMVFDKEQAKKQFAMRYYYSQNQDWKKYNFIQSEKIRLSTPRWDKITTILESYRNLGFSSSSTTGKILKGIYEKNKLMTLKRTKFMKTTNLLPLIARTETLLLAYKRIKRNRGALTKAARVDKTTLSNYDQKQRELYYSQKSFPDGFSLQHIELAGYLILKGRYPWGSSRRIWITKPGDPNKLRPITIPPFLDRVVQEAIKMVLYAIWEPDFEYNNNAFGFRPNKSCHDAIVALKSKKTSGLFKAIEGDIQGAYDNVDKNILIEQLSKKIEDKKFLKFMRNRLDYDYLDGTTRVKPELGIPQGGIDSPYLFNIYLSELDTFVNESLTSYLDNLNTNMKIPATKVGLKSKLRQRLKNKINSKKADVQVIKKGLKKIDIRAEEVRSLRYLLFRRIKEIRRLSHYLRRMESIDPSRRRLRLFYVRYADDWIILCNTDNQVATKMKEMIKHFLHTELKATLSDSKTLITDIRKEPAHFLGFEVSRSPRGRLIYVNNVLRHSPGLPIQLAPDRKRLINRLYSKGFCDKNGMPISVPWITNFETHIIIQRYNATIVGLAQYYMEWISWTSKLQRWIYILRYSCLKTLARKYRISTSKIFRRFGVDLFVSSKKTIEASIDIKVGDITYQKSWKLLTFADVQKSCLKQNRAKKLEKVFWDREIRKAIGNYELKGSTPTVTNTNFLDAITWVSLRTQASFDMPCCICGTFNNIEMHHIKHIRKSPYSKLPEKTFLQIMSLRNRKQIPVCSHCHRNVIHDGKYSGTALNKLLLTKTLIDNRTVHVETYVHKGNEHHAKTLIEKGWKVKQNTLLKNKEKTNLPLFGLYEDYFDEVLNSGETSTGISTWYPQEDLMYYSNE